MHARKMHARDMYAREVQRRMPMRDTPVRYTLVRYTPVRYTPMRQPPIRCTLVGCMPVRYVLIFENGFVVLGLAGMSVLAAALDGLSRQRPPRSAETLPPKGQAQSLAP